MRARRITGGCAGSVSCARAATKHDALTMVCWAVALMLPLSQAIAQSEVFKCSDGKQVTYSSTVCDKLGLKSAGAIRDRLTVISGDRPAATQAQAPATGSSAGDEEQKARKAAAAIKPVNPLIEQLVK